MIFNFVIVIFFFFMNLNYSITEKHARNLKPSDISYIYAIGESLTVGWAVKGMPIEYRGVGFSIGGDKGVVTLPNLIMSVPEDPPDNLFGMSYGVKIMSIDDKSCFSNYKSCQGNAAINGANIHRASYQVDYLEFFEKIYAKSYNFDGWKIITVFSGLSDVVFYNKSVSKGNPTPPLVFRKHFRNLLNKLSDKLGKQFVNVVALPENLFEISKIMNSKSKICKIIDWMDHQPGGINWVNETKWNNAAKLFNLIIEDEVNNFNENNYSQIFVSIQPFLKNWIPKSDEFEKLDCFHPNLQMEQNLAISLWNSMITDKKHKLNFINLTATIKIPGNNTFFQ